MRLKQAGYSIIEALIAVAVVAVAISLLGYFITSLQSMRTAQAETVGINWARTYTDTVRALWNSSQACAAAPAAGASASSGTCTAYPDAVLPPLLAPDGYQYAVKVTKYLADGQAGNVVTSCPMTKNCSQQPISDPELGNFPSRIMTVTTRDVQGKETTLSTVITRADVP